VYAEFVSSLLFKKDFAPSSKIWTVMGPAYQVGAAVGANNFHQRDTLDTSHADGSELTAHLPALAPYNGRVYEVAVDSAVRECPVSFELSETTSLANLQVQLFATTKDPATASGDVTELLPVTALSGSSKSLGPYEVSDKTKPQYVTFVMLLTNGDEANSTRALYNSAKRPEVDVKTTLGGRFKPDHFEGMTVKLGATTFSKAATVVISDIKEVTGGKSAYTGSCGGTEKGSFSSNIPANAQDLQIFHFCTVKDFPWVNGRAINRKGTSSIIAVWIDASGKRQWLWNISAGNYKIDGGFPSTREFQFRYFSGRSPKVDLHIVNSPKKDQGFSATVTIPKLGACLKLPDAS